MKNEICVCIHLFGHFMIDYIKSYYRFRRQLPRYTSKHTFTGTRRGILQKTRVYGCGKTPKPTAWCCGSRPKRSQPPPSNGWKKTFLCKYHFCMGSVCMRSIFTFALFSTLDKSTNTEKLIDTKLYCWANFLMWCCWLMYCWFAIALLYFNVMHWNWLEKQVENIKFSWENIPFPL